MQKQKKKDIPVKYYAREETDARDINIQTIVTSPDTRHNSADSVPTSNSHHPRFAECSPER